MSCKEVTHAHRSCVAPPRLRPNLPPPSGRFAPPAWDRDSPDGRRLDAKLPADHLARTIDQAVAQLDLTELFAAYGRARWTRERSCGLGQRRPAPSVCWSSAALLNPKRQRGLALAGASG